MLVLFLINVLVFDQFLFYDVFPSLDIPMHILGGIMAAWSVHRFIKIYLRSSLLFIEKAWIILGSVALIAITWEGGEMIADMFFEKQYQLGAVDTTVDLLLGVVGGIVYILGTRLKK